MATTNDNTSLVASTANLLERLGLLDLIMPAVRDRIQAIDAEALVDDVVVYVRRNPEILVGIFGSLTIASAVLVYLVRRAEEEEEARQQRQRAASRNTSSSSSKSRTQSKRRTAERKE